MKVWTPLLLSLALALSLSMPSSGAAPLDPIVKLGNDLNEIETKLVMHTSDTDPLSVDVFQFGGFALDMSAIVPAGQSSNFRVLAYCPKQFNFISLILCGMDDTQRTDPNQDCVYQQGNAKHLGIITNPSKAPVLDSNVDSVPQFDHYQVTVGGYGVTSSSDHSNTVDISISADIQVSQAYLKALNSTNIHKPILQLPTNKTTTNPSPTLHFTYTSTEPQNVGRNIDLYSVIPLVGVDPTRLELLVEVITQSLDMPNYRVQIDIYGSLQDFTDNKPPISSSTNCSPGQPTVSPDALTCSFCLDAAADSVVAVIHGDQVLSNVNILYSATVSTRT